MAVVGHIEPVDEEQRIAGHGGQNKREEAQKHPAGGSGYTRVPTGTLATSTTGGGGYSLRMLS